MQCNYSSDALNQLIVLLSRYTESNTDVGQNLNDQFLEQVNEKVALINSPALALSNSISLYFDLTSNYSSNEILTEFYDSLNLIAPYSENVEITHEEYLKCIGTKQENEAYQIYLNAEQSLGQVMKNIADGYKAFDVELKNQIEQIRKEMKKYE